MKVTEIRYEKLINVGHFSHVKGSAVIALSDGDSPIEAFAMARHLVKAQISEQVEQQEELPQAAPPRARSNECYECNGTGKIGQSECASCGGSGDDIPF